MGVDLTYFSGTRSAISVSDVFINGNIASRMGISLRKREYLSYGEVKDPLGNIIEVKSDIK